MPKSVQYEFSIPFDHPVEQLWPLVSDTPRLNEFVGNPKYQAFEVSRDDGSVDVYGQLRVAGITVKWLEVPVNWIENRWLSQSRRFAKGPIAELNVLFAVVEEGSGSRFNGQVGVESRIPLPAALVRRGLAKFERRVRAMLDNASRSLKSTQAVHLDTQVRLPAWARARAEQMVEQIESTAYGHGLAARLAEFVLGAQEVEVWSLRPLALAREWRVEPRAMVELFLQAVRAGLLESRWDLLCPRCRVSKEQSMKMDDIPDGVHCPSCNIDYEADFARNVELAFSPGPAVRPVEYGFFCRSGPAMTPHIRGQITLEPGEQMAVPAEFEPGAYRLRTLEAGGEVELEYDSGAFPGVEVDDQEVRIGQQATAGSLRFQNWGSSRRTLIIEDCRWRADVLTAERVMTLQAFRDLFSEQVLRPGDEVTISTITFMFTDLTSSTALFAQVGDARAYQIVREHFALLGAQVREHNGTIVKTTGDGIHAAFNAPDDAFRAALAMHARIAAADTLLAEADASIRIGLHTGSSISVTLNGRLDYYGSTVNMAARLEGQGRGGDITMSEAFVTDVAISPLLEGFEICRGEAELKGFDAPVPIYQVSAAARPD